jgi:hypothetical protein
VSVYIATEHSPLIWSCAVFLLPAGTSAGAGTDADVFVGLQGDKGAFGPYQLAAQKVCTVALTAGLGFSDTQPCKCDAITARATGLNSTCVQVFAHGLHCAF